MLCHLSFHISFGGQPAATVIDPVASEEALQRVCAAFLAAKERYQELVPAAFFERTMQDIKNATLVCCCFCGAQRREWMIGLDSMLPNYFSQFSWYETSWIDTKTKDRTGSNCFPGFHFWGLELDATSSSAMLSQLENREFQHRIPTCWRTSKNDSTLSQTVFSYHVENVRKPSSFWFGSNLQSPWKPRFMHRHGDADLTALITNSVPPLDVSRVAIFQVHLSKYNVEALFEHTYDTIWYDKIWYYIWNRIIPYHFPW